MSLIYDELRSFSYLFYQPIDTGCQSNTPISLTRSESLPIIERRIVHLKQLYHCNSVLFQYLLLILLKNWNLK